MDVGETVEAIDPQIQLQILGPTDGGTTLYYDRLPAPLTGAPEQARISVAMSVVNNRPTTIQISKITFNGISLVGPFSVPAGGTFPLQIDNGSMSYPPIVINAPVPATATIEVYEQSGVNNPVASKTLTLSSYTNDTGPMAWMGKSRDLAVNETWGATSAHAGNSGGLQSFALDVGVLGWDTINKTYQEFYGTTQPGTGAPGTRWHIYGRPMYAMNGGTVCFAVNDQPEKTGFGDPNQYKSALYNQWYPGGDQIFIKSAAEIAVYAHLQPGSIPPELLTPGAQVAKGQYIGKAGFSGSTDHPAPHVHVKTIPAGTVPSNDPANMNNCDLGLARPIGYTGPNVAIESEAIISASQGISPSFMTMNNQTAPNPYGLIYPSGVYSFCSTCTDTQEYIATVHTGSSIDVRAKAAGWSAFVAKRNELSADGFQLTQLETFKENNQQQFLGIFTRVTGTDDTSQDLQDYTDWGMFTQKANTLNTTYGRHLVDIATYVDTSNVRHFIGVFRPGTGVQPIVSYAGSTSFGNAWTNLSNAGYRLMEMETYPLPNGDRQYIGVYQPGTDAYAMWGGVGYTNFWNEVNTLNGQGLHLVDVESFPSGSDRVYIGVFRQGGGGLVPLRTAGYDNYVQLMEGENAAGYRSVDIHVEHD